MNNLDCSLIYRFINNFDELAYRRSFNNLEECEKKFINSCFKALKNSQKLYALKNKYTLKEFVLLANNISRKFYQSIKSPSSDNLQIMDQKILNHFKNIQ